MWLLEVLPQEMISAFIVLTDSALAGTIRGIQWSPDGKYVAIGGDSITGGTGDEFQIFSFDSANGTITSVAGALSGTVRSISWSPNGQYIVIGGQTITGNTDEEFQIFKFNRSTNSLDFITSALPGDDLQSVNWSPDGRFIAIGNNSTTADNDFEIYTAFDFPSRNIIQNNKLYCNSNGFSGCGISGSSISNMIIGNTSFDNPFNYVFVTNVFNQLFGDEPTKLQNVSLSSTDPIADRIDFPAELCRLERLAESLIDNLL